MRPAISGISIAAAAAFAAYVLSGAGAAGGCSLPGSGQLIRTFHRPGSTIGDGFGTVVACAADADGDSVPDLLIAAPKDQSPVGRVYMCSGATGEVLASFGGETAGDGFGSCLAVLEDIDGRGLGDVLVGAPLGKSALAGVPWRTYAKVFAAEDGALLFDSGAMPSHARYGASAAGMHDIDGDAVGDFAVGMPGVEGDHEGNPGRVLIYSGASGGVLTQVDGFQRGDAFGAALASLADIDGDGRSDLVPRAESSGTGVVPPRRCPSHGHQAHASRASLA